MGLLGVALRVRGRLRRAHARLRVPRPAARGRRSHQRRRPAGRNAFQARACASASPSSPPAGSSRPWAASPSLMADRRLAGAAADRVTAPPPGPLRGKRVAGIGNVRPYIPRSPDRSATPRPLAVPVPERPRPLGPTGHAVPGWLCRLCRRGTPCSPAEGWTPRRWLRRRRPAGRRKEPPGRFARPRGRLSPLASCRLLPGAATPTPHPPLGAGLCLAAFRG